ncbi:MAG: hypothetical protein CMA09_04945 [Euryarchaeota archaeon]|nr:hypothetical protein [Euryarchaeota archaeon]|tara:strand:- start:5619 stop:5867 length:249 start_codon:yes stop_codon:yes gene_type:complete
MTSEPTTLLQRDEQQGRRYPLFVERLLLLTGIVGFWFLHPMVLEQVDGIGGTIAAWCGLPLVLLMVVEIVGRFVQTVRNDSS